MRNKGGINIKEFNNIIIDSHKAKVRKFNRKIILTELLNTFLLANFFIYIIVMIFIILRQKDITANEIVGVVVLILINIFLLWGVKLGCQKLFKLLKEGIQSVEYATVVQKYFKSERIRNVRKSKRIYYADIITEGDEICREKVECMHKYFRAIKEEERVIIVSYDMKEYHLVKIE